MRRALALLLTTFSALACAQPVYRCESSSGQAAFQDLACVESSADGRADQSPLNGPIPQPAPGEMASFDVREGDGGWTYQQRMQRRREAKIEARAEKKRMQLLLAPSMDRRAAEYAENHRRCRNAVQVASMCGTRARTFSCDEKGFRADTIADANTPNPSAGIDNGSVFRMEQCALQAARGRP